MKAKKLMGVIACAGACVSLSALANTTNGWFGVSVNDTTVNAGSCSVTTNNVAVTSTETAGKIVLDNDLESALTITPGSGTAVLSDGLVTITSTAVLTPSDASELGAVTGGAQAGFAVAVDGNETNFYGYASAGGEGGAPDWIKFTAGPANPEADTTFTIAINYRDKKVSFYNGSTLLTDGTSSEFSISNEFVNLSNVAAYGSGSISSVTSQYEVAVVAYNGNKYGSVADAITAGGATGTIKDVTSSGAISEAVTAANGLPVAVCKALGISTTEENTAAVEIVPTATDPDEHNVTLQLDPSVQVESGVAVKFAVKQGNSEVTGSPFASNAIKVPLAAGTYTIEPVGVAVAP